MISKCIMFTEWSVVNWFQTNLKLAMQYNWMIHEQENSQLSEMLNRSESDHIVIFTGMHLA